MRNNFPNIRLQKSVIAEGIVSLNNACFLPTMKSICLPFIALCIPLALWAQTETPIGDGTSPDFSLEIDAASIERALMPSLNSYAPVLREVTPAVVSVYTAKVVRFVRQQGPRTREEEMLRRFFGYPVPRRRPITEEDIEERKVPQGVGSGVIVTADGYILTNNHVVTDERGNDADEVLVRLTDGSEYGAIIVGRDPNTDIAVLKIDAQGLPTANLANSDNLEVGDIVFAIGNPLGVGTTVTQGIISATGRAIGIYGEKGYEDFIQTDASINLGNSGGALVDTKGRLIGVNSAILSQTGGNIGIGFSIPTNLVSAVASQLVRFGEVRRGYLGVSTSDLTTEMAEAFDLKTTKGALVNQVEEEGPAALAGIQRGDVITRIDGRPVENTYELRLQVAQLLPGTEIEFDYYREGQRYKTSVLLGDQESLYSTTEDILEGVTVSGLTEENRTLYSVPEDISGVIITEVASDSSYARYFRAGMIFLEINDNKVRTAEEAKNALQRGVNKLYVYNQGQAGYLALRIR